MRVAIIAPYGFAACAELERIVIPSGVETIETGAFFGCKNLVCADLPDGLTQLGASAFAGCESLESRRGPARRRADCCQYMGRLHPFIFRHLLRGPAGDRVSGVCRLHRLRGGRLPRRPRADRAGRLCRLRRPYGRRAPGQPGRVGQGCVFRLRRHLREGKRPGISGRLGRRLRSGHPLRLFPRGRCRHRRPCLCRLHAFGGDRDPRGHNAHRASPLFRIAPRWRASTSPTAL